MLLKVCIIYVVNVLAKVCECVVHGGVCASESYIGHTNVYDYLLIYFPWSESYYISYKRIYD